MSLSADMRNLTHNTGLLPCIDVDLILFDGLRRRLVKGIFISGACIPKISHNSEGSFAKLLPKEDRTCAGLVCPSSTLGRWTTSKVEPINEMVCVRCPLAEPVDIVDILLSEVMSWS